MENPKAALVKSANRYKAFFYQATMKFFAFIFSVIIPTLTLSQTYSAALINKNDSLILPFASIKLKETGKFTTANDKGEFVFEIQNKLSELTFEIYYLGCNQTIKATNVQNKLNKIYIDCSPFLLKDISVNGMPAKDIVKKAISLIPLNYFDSSYASPCFYRQYSKTNNFFKNLVEVHGVTVFNLTAQNKDITSKEALAVEKIRRSKYYKIEDFEFNNFADHMSQNPIYHLTKGSLNPSALDFYQYTLDSVTSAGYNITYTCSTFSSENHGVDGEAFDGESTEYGNLTIDKTSFAIKKFVRNTKRNKEYKYPKYNNFVLPLKRFTEEFVEGQLVVEYQFTRNKWFLKSIVHSYTNEFFRTQTYDKTYVITEFHEWYAKGYTRRIDQNLLDKFHFNPALYSVNYRFNKNDWSGEIPFYYNKSDVVYKDLSKTIPLEQQFEQSGN